MSDTELRALTAQVKKLAARVEALERLLQRIIQQKPVSERQLERALRNWRPSTFISTYEAPVVTLFIPFARFTRK